MERSKDSEKSQRIISYHWREEAMLKRRLSSLESMKRQVELSFCLDQRILYSRFQTKLRRSAQASARMTSDEELIWRLAEENFPFNTTSTNDTERSISQLTGIANSHRFGSSGQRASTVPAGDRSRSACRPPRTILSRNAKCKPPQQEGGTPLDKTRSQSSQPSFRRVALPPSQHLGASALPPQKRAVKPRPITAAVAFQGSKELPVRPQPTVEEVGESAGEAVKDKLQTPAAKTLFEPPSKRLQDPSPKPKPLDDPVAPIPGREEAEEDQGEEEPSGATGGPDLAVRVSRFVENVKNMKHQGCITTDYYAHKLTESLSSRKEVLRVTEEPDRWSLVGSEKASRSITIQALDTARPAEEPPAELLILESYSALLTRENREERNWMDNNPYGSAGPSSAPR